MRIKGPIHGQFNLSKFAWQTTVTSNYERAWKLLYPETIKLMSKLFEKPTLTNLTDRVWGL